jgi:sugar phosphate isomerase/epimerase
MIQELAGAKRLAVVAGALNDDLRQAARLAREIGVCGLQLDVRGGGLDLTSLSHSGRREVRTVLSGAGVALTSLRADLGARGFSPKSDFDAAIDRLEQAMTAAQGLGCGLVCAEVGEIAGDETGGSATLDDALRELGRRADRQGVMVALRSELAPFSALSRALTAAACPWLGIDFDPVAFVDAWNLDQIFSRVGGLVRHVRARDAVGGSGGRTRPAAVGAGSVDWPAVLASLAGAGYSGWFGIDPVDQPNRLQAAMRAAGYLGKMIL